MLANTPQLLAQKAAAIEILLNKGVKREQKIFTCSANNPNSTEFYNPECQYC